MHCSVSRFETHVISAILNIGQAVTRDWDLHILDNEGAPHTVTLQVRSYSYVIQKLRQRQYKAVLFAV